MRNSIRPPVWFFLACATIGFACQAMASESTGSHEPEQSTLDAFSRSLKVTYRVISNHPGNCPGGELSCFRGRIELSSTISPPPTWRLYFNTEARFLSQSSENLRETGINGDLHEITASKAAARGPFDYRLDFIASGAQPTPYYAMPNWYVTAEGMAPRIIDSTRPHVEPDSGIESHDFVAPFTDENALAKRWEQDQTVWPKATELYAQNLATQRESNPADAYRVVPQPLAMHLDTGGQPLYMHQGIALHLAGFDRSHLGTGMAQLSQRIPETGSGIPLYLARSKNGHFGAEGYAIKTDASGIHVEAGSDTGADYALITLAQLADHAPSLPQLQIDDRPRYPFRGLMIDVARNFPGKAELLRLLDQMEAYKLNKLHLHLSDDQGWRLQIPGLPELTDIGAQRCHDLLEQACILPQLGSGPTAGGAGDGYLSRQDYLDLVRAAAARHIEVIPSFDMPGHSHAAIVSMEARFKKLEQAGDPVAASRYRLREPEDRSSYRSVQGFSDNTINVCLDSSFVFFEKVLDEVASMHAEAGVPLRRYQIGGDETPGAWKESPACKALAAKVHLTTDKLGGLFVSRAAKAVAERGALPGAWSDGLANVDPATMPSPMQSNTWEMLFYQGPDIAHRQMNQAGWQVILSIPDVTYFDQPYSPAPNELGNGWAARDLDDAKAFGFMPDNLGANGYFWKNLLATHGSVEDNVSLYPGRQAYGMQAQLWTEFVHDPQQVEYMLFPRLIAFSERAWHHASWEIPYAGATSKLPIPDNLADIARQRDRDWASFAAVMSKKILPELDRDGIRYRIPPTGAQLSNGTLYANSVYPGLPLQYQLDAGPWTDYTGPVRVPNTANVHVRSLSTDRKRAGLETSIDRPTH